jgi:curved DNA-binding protein CbpA
MIGQDADAAAIRSAYHRQARRFHPDRHHHLDSPPLHARLTSISKRIAEAYIVLRDDETRSHYLRAITGPERDAHLRYSEASEKRRKEEREEKIGKTPQVQQLYRSARLAFAKGDPAAAIKNLRMALTLEPDNGRFKSLLDEWSGNE